MNELILADNLQLLLSCHFALSALLTVVLNSSLLWFNLFALPRCFDFIFNYTA